MEGIGRHVAGRSKEELEPTAVQLESLDDSLGVGKELHGCGGLAVAKGEIEDTGWHIRGGGSYDGQEEGG